MRALLGDLRSVCLGIGSGTPVSNLTPQKTIPNFANRVTGSDATQHNTTQHNTTQHNTKVIKRRNAITKSSSTAHTVTEQAV